MKALVSLTLPFVLTGCCLIQPEKCKVQEVCTPKEPIVQYQYNTLPDYLVAPCVRPGPLKDPVTLESLAKEFDKRKGEQNLCADRMDALRLRNEEYKKANKEELLP